MPAQHIFAPQIVDHFAMSLGRGRSTEITADWRENDI
jgi:hypothetical protein